jgi:hypothetical protein
VTLSLSVWWDLLFGGFSVFYAFYWLWVFFSMQIDGIGEGGDVWEQLQCNPMEYMFSRMLVRT